MSELLDKLSEPLSIDQIDFRVQSINNGGYATILAYKDARVDINRLNSVLGPGYWQRSHELIGDRLYCRVGIYNETIQQWSWVQDVGVESRSEAEKGQASDSFKRACFNLGIGIELYDYPVIQVKLKDDEWEKGQNNKPNRATWKLKLRDWVWYSEHEGRQLSFLAAKDDNDGLRFKWGLMKKDK